MLLDDFFAKLCAQFLLNVTLWVVRQCTGSRYAREVARIVREGAQGFEPARTFRSARDACARVYASSSLEIICMLMFGSISYEAFRYVASLSSTVAHIGELFTLRWTVAIPLTVVMLVLTAAALPATVVAQRGGAVEQTPNA